MVLAQNGQIDLRKGRLKMNPRRCSHLILDKGTKTYIGKKTASLTSGAVKTRYQLVED
jgi:hypothetical protein